jgi:hypothetical protein
MDFFIERNFKILKEIKIENYYCNFCNTKTKLNLSVKGGFVSVFLIPMLPFRKLYLLNCDNCKKDIGKKSLNYIEKEKIENTVKNTTYKIPIYHFTGFAILLVILGFGIYTGIEVTKEEKIRIQKPEIGDIYRVKTESGYTTLKVNKFSTDSILVFLNDIQVDNYDKIDDIDISKNYNKSRLFSKHELLNMFNENIIYQVDREIPEP